MMGALYDAHAHLGEAEEQALRAQEQVCSWVCATQPEEARRLEGASQANPYLIPTYGLHPWYADRFEVGEMESYLGRGRLLGEIGMDSVWCSVDLDRQRGVFVEQLQWAERRRMPVILHTKGQERAIGKLLQRYTMPVLVHWYSCEDGLEAYLERDCYFTVGPDVAANPAVQQVARCAPLDRLLVETDGMDAVRWALGQDTPLDRLPAVLERSMDWIAQVKGLDRRQVAAALERNFLRLNG